MSQEGGMEKATIELTQEEFDLLANRGMPGNDDARVDEIMSQKGIQLNSGIIEVTVDGKPKEMVTDEEDFGTAKIDLEPGVITEETPEKE